MMKGWSLRSYLWTDYLQGDGATLPVRGFYNNSTEDFDLIPAGEFIKYCCSVYAGNECLFTGKKIVVINAAVPMAILTGFYAAIFSGLPPLIIPSRKSLGDSNPLSAYIDTVLESFGPEGILLLTDDVGDFNTGTGGRFAHLDHFELPQKTTTDIAPAYNVDGWIPPEHGEETADEIAFFQLTSGSTANGKLIAITNSNVVENITGIYQSAAGRATDAGISWLPLYHDMGLVGSELFCLLNKMPFYLMAPFDFLRAPHLWFLLADKYKCTLSPSPNFGFEYCNRFTNHARLEGCDLSLLRCLFSGAEPIDLTVLSKFYHQFSRYGLKQSVFVPSYGLAEATLAVSLSDMAVPIQVAEVEVDQYSPGSKVRLLAEHAVDFEKIPVFGANTIRLPALGPPLKGVSVYVIDEDKNILADGIVGEILIKGTSVAKGYLAQGQLQPFNGVHETGDLGFTWNRQIYIIDRIKNTIIKNGKNISIAYLEYKLADVLDIGSYHIAVFERSIFDNGAGSPVVAFVESVPDISRLERQSEEVQRALQQYHISRAYISGNRIICRTTSGKKQYFKCRQLIDRDGQLKQKGLLILDAYGDSSKAD